MGGLDIVIVYRGVAAIQARPGDFNAADSDPEAKGRESSARWTPVGNRSAGWDYADSQARVLLMLDIHAEKFKQVRSGGPQATSILPTRSLTAAPS